MNVRFRVLQKVYSVAAPHQANGERDVGCGSGHFANLSELRFIATNTKAASGVWPLPPLPLLRSPPAAFYPRGSSYKDGLNMFQTRSAVLAILLTAFNLAVLAQSSYQVISVTNGGTISGTVKWSGPEPKGLDVAVNKDLEICDPESHKTGNLERMVIGPDGGVANTRRDGPPKPGPIPVSLKIKTF